jgi:hypothetical protein
MVDTFAHALWSWIIFRNYLFTNKEVWLAVFFGVAPDLFSWTIYLFYNLITNGFKIGKPALEAIPNWIFTLYGITHSLFVFAFVALACFIALKHVPIYLWAWLIHILIDIPTHSRDFLPTPFLWPLSSWHFPGISWGTPVIMIINWAGILFFLGKIALEKIKT